MDISPIEQFFSPPLDLEQTSVQADKYQESLCDRVVQLAYTIFSMIVFYATCETVDIRPISISPSVKESITLKALPKEEIFYDMLVGQLMNLDTCPLIQACREPSVEGLDEVEKGLSQKYLVPKHQVKCLGHVFLGYLKLMFNQGAKPLTYKFYDAGEGKIGLVIVQNKYRSLYTLPDIKKFKQMPECLNIQGWQRVEGGYILRSTFDYTQVGIYKTLNHIQNIASEVEVLTDKHKIMQHLITLERVKASVKMPYLLPYIEGVLKLIERRLGELA